MFNNRRARYFICNGDKGEDSILHPFLFTLGLVLSYGEQSMVSPFEP